MVKVTVCILGRNNWNTRRMITFVNYTDICHEETTTVTATTQKQKQHTLTTRLVSFFRVAV